MTEQLIDNTANQAAQPPQIERMPLPAPLYDWSATGAHPVNGREHGSTLEVIYADEAGLLNPYGQREERGDEKPLRYEGPNRTNDLTLLRKIHGQDASGDPVTKWQAFVVQRLRTRELASPGGFHDPEDADGLAGGLRELTEETGVTLPFDEPEARRRAQTIFAGPTLSSRASTRRWVETEFNVIILSGDEADTLEVTPQTDEVLTVEWIDLDKLASGHVDETPVRPSHVPYFAHLQAELAKAS